MAGMDFSCVIEPDYRPENFRQAERITSHIEDLVSDLWSSWKNRDRVRKERWRGKVRHERYKSIFYDTDRIVEKQRERIKLCNYCKGFFYYRVYCSF